MMTEVVNAETDKTLEVLYSYLYEDNRYAKKLWDYSKERLLDNVFYQSYSEKNQKYIEMVYKGSVGYSLKKYLGIEDINDYKPFE